MATYDVASPPPGGRRPKRPRTKWKRSREELERRVREMVRDALTYHQTEIAPFRLKAGRYYRGEPFGDEEAGRSRVVITTLRDAVKKALPAMMDVFFGPDGIVEYRARRPELAPLARLQTDYINHVILSDNPGFLILYGALKDAMVRRIGVVKWRWDERREVESQRLVGVTQTQLEALLAVDPDLEVDEIEESEDGTLSVVISKTVDKSGVVIEAVPPEEFVWNRGARSIQDAVLVAHVTERTAGDLLAMGYTQKVLDEVGADARLLAASEERALRSWSRGAPAEADESAKDENARYTYVEAYVKLDMGRGIEHRKICLLGAELRLVNNEPAPDRPFAVFTPDPEPHEIQGTSLADDAMDLQRIHSHLARGILNSLNLSLNPRTAFDDKRVNLKDLMNVEIGANVRVQGDVHSALRELTHTFVGREGLAVMEYFKGIEEERLGTTRAAAGLRPDALQSSTREAVENTVAKEQARLRLMARVFAETGMRQLFEGLYRLVRRHQRQARVVPLHGEYVEVAPQLWPLDPPEVQVRVGIGAGTRGERLAFLREQAQRQEAALQAFGLGSENPLTDLSLYRATLAEEVRVSGDDPARYWKEVTPETLAMLERQKAEAAQAQPPDPAMLLAQAQIQAQQDRTQVDAEKARAEQEYRLAQLDLERERLALQDDRERDKLDAEIALRARELELKYQQAVDVASIKAAVAASREPPRPRAAEADAAEDDVSAEGVGVRAEGLGPVAPPEGPATPLGGGLGGGQDLGFSAEDQHLIEGTEDDTAS